MRNSNYLRQGKRRQNKAFAENEVGFMANDEIVGKDTLAGLLEVTVTQVERWIRDGMPFEQRGDNLHDWVFNLQKVKHWKESD